MNLDVVSGTNPNGRFQMCFNWVNWSSDVLQTGNSRVSVVPLLSHVDGAKILHFLEVT